MRNVDLEANTGSKLATNDLPSKSEPPIVKISPELTPQLSDLPYILPNLGRVLVSVLQAKSSVIPPAEFSHTTLEQLINHVDRASHMISSTRPAIVQLINLQANPHEGPAYPSDLEQFFDLPDLNPDQIKVLPKKPIVLGSDRELAALLTELPSFIHDSVGPLTSVRGYAQLYQKGVAESSDKIFEDRIINGILIFRRMCDALLDPSFIDTRIDPFINFFEDLLKQALSISAKPGSPIPSLTSEIDDSDPNLLLHHRIRLKVSILERLASVLAANFYNVSAGKMHLRISQLDGLQQFVRFSIEDNGPGYPKVLIDNGFDGSHGYPDPTIPSHGLGLKGITEMIEKSFDPIYPNSPTGRLRPENRIGQSGEVLGANTVLEVPIFS